MDPTLKKRLIGAAILIVLAAIILPMFLGGPPQPDPTGTTLPLDIPPAPDRDLAQVTLPLPADRPTGDAPDPDPDRIASVDTSQLPPPPAPEPEAAPEPDSPSESEPALAPAPAPEPSAPASAAPTTSPPPATAVPAASADGRFWVALGSYGQAGNADRVAAAARAASIQVERSTVTTGGRELIRLRAGPWATRAQAEQARQQLIAAVPDARPKVEEAAGIATADAPAPDPGAPARAGAWAVQVGAFAQRATAEQLATRLRATGYPAFVERRGERHAVRVGPYVRRTEAEAQRQQLKSGQQLDGLIVAHPG